MHRTIQFALLGLLIAATAFIGVCTWGVLSILPLLRSAAYNVSLTAYNANGTVGTANGLLASLDAPCRDFQGDWICGPIPQLAQTEKNIGILAAKSAQQVQQSATLVNTASQSLKDTAQAVTGTASAATGLLASAQKTTDKLPTTLTALNGAIGNIGDLAGTGNDSLNEINRILASKSLKDAIDGTGQTAQNVAGITGSMDKMTAHLEKNFDSPQPIWKTMIPMSEDAGKIITCLWKHVCVQ